MDAIIGLLKFLLKVFLLFIGGIMLLGGGLCAIVGVGNIGNNVSSMLMMVGIALAVALAGWGIIKAAKAIGQSDIKQGDEE